MGDSDVFNRFHCFDSYYYWFLLALNVFFQLLFEQHLSIQPHKITKLFQYFSIGEWGGGSRDPRVNFFHFQVVFGKKWPKQDCIPVRCVPPASVAVSGEGGLPREKSTLGGEGLPNTHTPVDRQTLVKILPCPKLRLRAVIIVHLWGCHPLYVWEILDPPLSFLFVLCLLFILLI